MPINSKNLARRLAGLFRQAPVLWTTVFLLTTRMPFMLLYYPGCFAFPDTESCINHYYGLQDTISRLCGSDCARPLDNHHPIIYTFLYGWTIDLGNLIGSQNVAVFLFLLLQATLHSWPLAQIIVWARRHGAPRWLLPCYMLFPVFGMWSTLFLKDSFFSLCTSALTLCLLHWGEKLEEGTGQRTSLPLAIATFCSLCFFKLSKNQCVYIAVLLLIALPWLYGRKCRRLATVTAASIAVFSIFSINLPRMGVAQSGRQETIGTMLQQTACYARCHPKEISAEERAAIDAVIPFDSLAVCYRAEIQDPVKYRYRRLCSGKERARYYKVWAKMGLRHPECYAKAVWGCCSAYFYPSGKYPLFYPAHQWEATYPELFRLEPLLEKVPCGMAQIIKIPIVGWPFDMGFLMPCFVLVMFYLMWRRQRIAVLALFPCLVSVAVLVISPANGIFRYVMPIVWHIPLALAFAMSKRR